MKTLTRICAACDVDGSLLAMAEEMGQEVTHGLCRDHALQLQRELEEGAHRFRADLRAREVR